MMWFSSSVSRGVGIALALVIGFTTPAFARQAPPSQEEQPAPEAVALHLSDGTVLIGEVLEEADGKIRVRTRLLGDVSVDSDNVDHRGPVEAPPETVVTHKAQAAAPPEHTAAPSWTRAITTSTALVSAPFKQGEISPAVPGLTGAALRLPGAQKSMQMGFTVRHTDPRDTFSLSGSWLFVDAEPVGRMSEALTLDLEYSNKLSERTYVLSSTTFRRDAVRNIDNSFAELGGFGYKLVKNARLQADIVGGGALLRENKNTPYDDKWQPQVGVMEAFLFNFNPRAWLSHRITYRAGLRDTEVWSLESYTAIQAAITSHFSIVSGLTWNHDNVLGEAVTPLPPNALFPGSPALELRASLKTFRQFTSGLQFTF